MCLMFETCSGGCRWLKQVAEGSRCMSEGCRWSKWVAEGLRHVYGVRNMCLGVVGSRNTSLGVVRVVDMAVAMWQLLPRCWNL